MILTKRLSYCLALAAMSLVSQLAIAATGTADDAMIERGKYLATAGDCVACHTAPGDKPFAGGLLLPTPVGNIMATNITPSKTHGIGHYSLEEFSAAMRKGIRRDGQHLYPAMPYTAYAKVSDEDIKAIYAYFMNGVEPVNTSPPATELPFPFNVRLSMMAWNLLFLDKQVFHPDPDQGELWNRGAYLARGLTHCTTCHTPRNMFMAEDLSRELGGGEVGNWYASNITSDLNSGVGGWSVKELVDYLRTGRSEAKAQASGPMAEAIDHSLQYLTETDLEAIATYVKSVPAIHDAGDTKPVYAWGGPVDELNSIRGVALPKDPDQMTGAQLYDANCATCHQDQAQGSAGGGLPSLFHNTALGRTNTNNLVMVILEGITRQTPASADVLMQGFKTDMSDRQIATLSNYLIQHYGNPQAQVTVEQVKSLRAGSDASVSLVWIARAGMALAVVVLLGIILVFTRRRRAHRKAR